MRIRPFLKTRTLSLILPSPIPPPARPPPGPPRPAAPPEPKPNESTDPMLRGFEFRSIGPAVMMGRLDDIVGTEKDPMLLYIGFATGGVWKSTDGGNYWHSQFD